MKTENCAVPAQNELKKEEMTTSTELAPSSEPMRIEKPKEVKIPEVAPQISSPPQTTTTEQMKPTTPPEQIAPVISSVIGRPTVSSSAAVAVVAAPPMAVPVASTTNPVETVEKVENEPVEQKPIVAAV